MHCKERLESYFRENMIPYQVQHHAKVFTAQEIAATEHIPGKLLAKTVIANAEGKTVMLVLPSSETVDLHAVSLLTGTSEVSLAKENEFSDIFADAEVGAMPPFGNLYGIPVYVDSSLAEDRVIFFRAGNHTDTMSLKYADFSRLVNPIVAAFKKEKVRF